MTKKLIYLTFIVLLVPALSYCIEPEVSKPAVIYERVQVTTDRKLYIAGENLLFGFYLIDTRINKLASYQSTGYILLKNTNGTIVGKSQVKIREGRTSGVIYLNDTLQSGYYQIEAFTNFMRNGSPDFFFRTEIMVANRFDKDLFGLVSGATVPSTSTTSDYSIPISKELISLVPVKPICNKRERNGFKLIIKDTGIKSANVTVSVVEKNSVEENAVRNIRTIKGPLAQNIANGELPAYLAEDKYDELIGQLTDADNGNGLPNRTLYLSSPDTVANLNYTTTDSKGYFRFALQDYYNGKDLYIKVKKNGDETLKPKITIDSKYTTKPFIPEFQPVDSSTLSYIQNSQDVVKIQKSYLQLESQQKTEFKSGTDIPYLYRTPNYVTFPGDYSDLKNFTEIARELISTLRIRKRDNINHAEILDYINGRYMDSDPLIIADGVLIDDINQLLPYGSKDIRKVEVISSEWYMDLQEFNGVIAVFSNNNLMNNIFLNTTFNIKIKANEYFQTPEFYTPDYSLTDVNAWDPDFRQVLYWNPDIQINKENEQTIYFYTSDYAATYVIKVRGIADNGEVIESYCEFEVND